ncbi:MULTISPECIES: thiol peroxidase [Pseudoalteromonas]|jgi:thiol peroxidase|uniref:2-Cys peroxiredoxin n=1 Tax=Pseudoalteromonas tetraodonis TaxID=43659 RepID=A0ABD4EJM6_9GAMM|nr:MULTISPECIES: thiol peroxidase [Pseudoalteromonas]MAY58583.1 lipid hydroperoxide peroxidase [Pseudoalteromonas sp.]KYL31104.1 2-Cys peroxiredoxin [Pseudoalteromonas spiralis]MDN3393757.1 thiol peroxidase [Pseudoalteromonas sp. APC 3215]MDN3400551.1 thiol peroxidase [Pseudoalteromonas sp. APC 3213]MDN3405290.1 thiol peroxidase [Pseudoalteromonas sp. APC 3218]|tara:strand:- start:542 stop:1123 length:582 start_codon:yes stop_codon:yes gene_type:complete
MRRSLAFALSLFCCTSFASELPENTLDAGKVTAQGKPVTLLGQGLKVGADAPNFKVVDDSFTAITLENYQGQAVLISVVPSLDTGICSLQTKHFNEKVAQQFPGVAMLTISADLPFAQKRFCKAENIDKVTTLSDSVWRDFGQKYGLIIKDMGLLTRAVFILDKSHKVIYKQLVTSLSTEPEYDSVIEKLKTL